MSKKILLINPSMLYESDSKYKSAYPYPPMGLLSLSGILKMHGYEVFIYDFFRHEIPDPKEFLNLINDVVGEPFIIGISTYSQTYSSAVKIAKLLKNNFSKSKIIFGGPHATFTATDILNNVNEIEFIVRNEGEASFVELLEHINYPDLFDIKEVKGVSFRNHEGTVINNPKRESIYDLDLLPLPDYEMLDQFGDTISGDTIKKDTFIFMTSRGCPGNCVFCSSRAMSGKRYRFHSSEWLISSVYVNYNLHKFTNMVLLDDTFLVNKNRVMRFCNFLDKLKLKVPWSCKSRVDTLDEDVIKRISESNCRSIHIGVESADDKVLESIDKTITLSQILEGIKLIKKYSMRVECSFIIGHHSDTPTTIKKTLILAKAIRKNNIGFSIIGISTPFPGTPIYEQSDLYGLRIIENDFDLYDLNTPIYETDNFTMEDLEKAFYHFNVESNFDSKKSDMFKTENIDDFNQTINSFISNIKEINKLGEVIYE